MKTTNRPGSVFIVLAACGAVAGCGAAQAPAEVEAQALSLPTCSVTYASEATINADIDIIWDVLTDLPHYSDWNPWVIEASGSIAPDQPVPVTVILNGNKQHADHIVGAVDRPTHFCWDDAGWNGAIVHGERCRWLDKQPDGTVHFHQTLVLSDWLAPLAGLIEGKTLQAGMDAETAALKKYSEHIAGTAP
jgi:hypothetical protein